MRSRPVRLLAVCLALLPAAGIGAVARADPSGPAPLPTPQATPAPTEGVETTPAPPAEADEQSCGLSIGCAVQQAIGTVFSAPQAMVDAEFLAWLLRVPDLQGSSPGFGHAADVTRAAAWALLGGLVTFALFSYWATGLTSRGGGGAFADAIVRCCGAATFILAWPWAYRNGVALADTLTYALLPRQLGVDAGIGVTTVPLSSPLLGIVVSLALVIVMLGLYLTKVGLAVGLCVACLAAPIAAALWVVPAMSQPLGYAARYCAAALSTQAMWALCLLVFAELRRGMLTISDSDTWTSGLQNTLLGIAVLASMLAMPRHMFRAWWGNAADSGSGLARSAGAMLQGFARQAAANHLPDRWGGRKDTLSRIALDHEQRQVVFAQRRQDRSAGRGGGPAGGDRRGRAEGPWALDPTAAGPTSRAARDGGDAPGGRRAQQPGEGPVRDGADAPRRGGQGGRRGGPEASGAGAPSRPAPPATATAMGSEGHGGGGRRASAHAERGPAMGVPERTQRRAALRTALATVADAGHGYSVFNLVEGPGRSGHWADVTSALGQAARNPRHGAEVREAFAVIATASATEDLRDPLMSWVPPAARAGAPFDDGADEARGEG